MMERIKNILEEMKQTDPNWKEYKEVSDIKENDTLRLLNELVEEIRPMLKLNRKKELEELPKFAENEELSRDIIGFSQYTLRHYYAWSMVRELESGKEDLVPVLFQNVMDRAILRVDPDFFETYETYGAEDQDQFMEMLNSFDTLVTYYVQKHFIRKAIIRDIIEETEINDANAEVFADLIEKNYRKLQINIILDKLEETNI